MYYVSLGATENGQIKNHIGSRISFSVDTMDDRIVCVFRGLIRTASVTTRLIISGQCMTTEPASWAEAATSRIGGAWLMAA